ncbi:MAG: tetratricopeptide repeat protein [Myxococcota bacterium]|nr:tetratricopeptide repeat protein [Myxococcota bacterium]
MGLLILGSVGVFQPGSMRAEGLLLDGLRVNGAAPLAPSQKEAALQLGRVRVALDQAQWDEAEALLEEVPGLAVLSDHVEFQRIRLLAGRNQNQAVVDRTQALLLRFPKTPLMGEIAALRAGSLVSIGDEEAAQEAFALALSNTDDPERRGDLRRSIASSRRRMGKPDDGKSFDSSGFDLEGVEILAQEKPIALRTAFEEMEAARVWASSGRNEKAVAAYQRSLEGELSEEERKEVQFQLGELLFQLREYERALVLFRSLAPDPRATFMWARSLARVGQLDQSIEKFESLVAGDSHEEADHAAYLAGTLRENNGNEQAARALYARVVEKTKSRSRRQAALWRLGWLSWRRGDSRDARLRFDEMMASENSALARLRPRYWSARAALRSSSAKTRREGEAEMVMLATEWPLSYYGWRAQQRLGRISPHASASRRSPISGDLASSAQNTFRRIELLQLAGFDESARSELAQAASTVGSMRERVEVGRLAVSLDDFHTGQGLLVQAHSELLGRGFEPSRPALFWLAWPPAYRPVVLENLPQDGSVEAELVWAIMREESGFRPEVMSSAGAVGLLQLMPETAESTAASRGLAWWDDLERLQSPETNIKLGTAYLASLSRRFPGRVSAVIASYNAGPTAVARWLEGDAAELDDDEWVEEIPYTQTRSYTKRVLRSLYAYRSFY